MVKNSSKGHTQLNEHFLNKFMEKRGTRGSNKEIIGLNANAERILNMPSTNLYKKLHMAGIVYFDLDMKKLQQR